MHAQLVKLK